MTNKRFRRRGESVASTQPLRVLHLWLGVGETSVANEFCIGARHDIAIVTFFKSGRAFPSSVRVYQGDGSVGGFVRALGVALDAEDYDIVHAHTVHVAFLFLVSRLWRRKAPKLTVYTVHCSFSNSNLRIRNRLLLMPVFALFHRVVCVSRASLDSFPKSYRWLARHRLSAILNGVDTRVIDEAARGMVGKQNDHCFRLISVGRLIDIKSPHTVLQAFLEIVEPKSHLVLVGEGDARTDLVERATHAGLQGQVEFRGALPRLDVYRLLADADVFVSASRGEGMPVAVLEAMACRRAVVATRVGGLAETVVDEVTGLLVDADDAPALGVALTRLVGDAPLRQRLGQAGAARVAESYLADQMVTSYERLYRDALEAGDRR